MTDLEVELAVARHDVERGAAADDARVDCRVRYVVCVVVLALVAERARDVGEVGDDLAGDLDGVDAERRQRRMRFVSAHAAAPALLALVRDDELHAGRLADDAAQRLDAARDDVVDQPPHADAADLLVVGQREMQRPREAAAHGTPGTIARPVAEKLFMSVTPRPTTRSPISVASNGSVSHGWPSTGTTSVCPDNTMPPVVALPSLAAQRREEIRLCADRRRTSACIAAPWDSR